MRVADEDYFVGNLLWVKVQVENAAVSILYQFGVCNYFFHGCCFENMRGQSVQGCPCVLLQFYFPDFFCQSGNFFFQLPHQWFQAEYLVADGGAGLLVVLYA